MRRFLAVSLALASTMATAAAPAAAATGPGGFAVTRITVGGRVMSLAADPTAGVVYAADSPSSQSSVVAIDAATGKIVATIDVPMFPRDVTVDSATHTVYAVGDSPAKIAVINGSTDAVTTTISLPSRALPVAVAVNPSTHRLYVGDYTTGNVYVFNTVSNKRTATIPLKDPAHEPGQPFIDAIAVDTATNQIYVSDVTNHLVAVIGGATGQVTHRISLHGGAFPGRVAVGSGSVYVAEGGTNAISVISTATDTVTATIPGLTGISHVAIGPAGTLYAVAPEGGPTGFLGVTYVVDTAAGNTITQLPRGGEWVTVESGSAYLSNGFGGLSDSVSVITPSSATAMCPIFTNPPESFIRGRARHVQLAASAIPSASFSAKSLPAGLTLSPAGLLSGTPTGSSGFHEVPVTVTNGISPSDTGDLEIVIDQSPAITSPAHATFEVGTPGEFQINATGWPTPTITVSGALPRGVSKRPRWLLAGRPAKRTGGIYKITLTANNASGIAATQKLTLTVDEAPTITSPGHVTFHVGHHGTFTIETRGFPAARLTESGQLPPGIKFRLGPNGTATLSGKPHRSAHGHSYRIGIAATNGIEHPAHQIITITVR